jgi:hypothetical protein
MIAFANKPEISAQSAFDQNLLSVRSQNDVRLAPHFERLVRFLIHPAIAVRLANDGACNFFRLPNA